MAVTGRDIAQAKSLLQHGELVAVPTETVYGLAGNALHVPAITKIFEVKERPSFDPLIVHIPELSHLAVMLSTFRRQHRPLQSTCGLDLLHYY
jgi:L-threonylcarbamoyladenylate synthase